MAIKDKYSKGKEKYRNKKKNSRLSTDKESSDDMDWLGGDYRVGLVDSADLLLVMGLVSSLLLALAVSLVAPSSATAGPLEVWLLMVLNVFALPVALLTDITAGYTWWMWYAIVLFWFIGTGMLVSWGAVRTTSILFKKSFMKRFSVPWYQLFGYTFSYVIFSLAAPALIYYYQGGVSTLAVSEFMTAEFGQLLMASLLDWLVVPVAAIEPGVLSGISTLAWGGLVFTWFVEGAAYKLLMD